MTNTPEKRRRSLDPCHRKILKITGLQLARMKLKMKVELRALKKITEEVIQDGANSVVVLPANVYENPLDTIPNQLHEGFPGYYGLVTERQLKSFFGNGLPKPVTITIKENPTNVSIAPDELERFSNEFKPSTAASQMKIFDYDLVPRADEDTELQNAIWNICPESIAVKAVSSDEMDSNNYIMENTREECVLFNLS